MIQDKQKKSFWIILFHFNGLCNFRNSKAFLNYEYYCCSVIQILITISLISTIIIVLFILYFRIPYHIRHWICIAVNNLLQFILIYVLFEISFEKILRMISDNGNHHWINNGWNAKRLTQYYLSLSVYDFPFLCLNFKYRIKFNFNSYYNIKWKHVWFLLSFFFSCPFVPINIQFYERVGVDIASKNLWIFVYCSHLNSEFKTLKFQTKYRTTKLTLYKMHICKWPN